MMKHKGFIDIDQSRDKVVEIFKNPANLSHYQDGFIRKVLVSGKEGEVGTISKMYYQHGKHEMELTETITLNEFPDRFESQYHHIHMDNTMKCNFIELGEKKTRYEYEYEYTRINWIMPRLVAILFPSMYKKPAEKWLRQFKEFAEKS